MRTMRLEIVSMTPQRAVEYLARPWSKQRRISAPFVRKYARAMAEGRWVEPSLDPIAFNVEGELANGQHRLYAVIEAEWQGEMLVAFDAPEEAFLVHDTGRHRLAAQFVQLTGAKDVASAARMILWYDQRHPLWPNGQTAFDNDEILGFISENEEALARAVGYASAARKAASVPAGIHGAVLFIADRGGIADDVIGQWAEGVISGSNLEADDPRLRLRNRLLRDAAIRRDKNAVWSMVCRAFNAFNEGRALGSLLTSYHERPPVVKFTPHQTTALREPRRGTPRPGNVPSAAGANHGPMTRRRNAPPPGADRAPRPSGWKG